jgi:hypothetical protein
MQFPVPQFTDVEDKIIGPLTIKQFGIVFGMGMILFLGYSATKSVIVLIFLFMILGIPALALAFGKVNGRPIYNSIGYFVAFFLSPKVMVFHKQGLPNKVKEREKQQQQDELAAKAKNITSPVTPATTQDNLRKIQELLKDTQSKEEEMMKGGNNR